MTTEAVDALMHDAQVFASAWSLVGGRFDQGDALERAEYCKNELRAAITAALAAERERSMIALREWAVLRWRDEVQNRPLVNKNRRPLDDTWRQVMRYAGLDPDEAVGPSHDVIRAQEPTA